MGIHGLLPQLKSIMSPIHVEELRGRTVAVDTYSWLHKGALSCSAHLCKGLPTSKHIDYCMHRVNLLRHYGIKPILVFDGGLLPMKIDQETKRARVRKENLERAMEHEASGNSTAAFECYQKAVDISPSIACELIQVLKQEKVDYIVAPYEADAQMTFLSINKHVDAVITEDSDLIPFGCSRIIFKMDKFGQGVEFQSSMLGKNRELDFTGFTKTMLLEMCILSGCDYLQSLPGMGLKRGHALIQKLKSHEKVIKHLRYSAVSVPPSYEDSFKQAMWAFQYQRVYDPVKEDIVHLSDVPYDLGHELDFLGPWLPQTVVKGIAKGELDPFTKMPFQEKDTCMTLVHSITYSEKQFAPANGRKKLDLPVQKNVVTNYFCLASLEAKRKFRAPKIMRRQSETMESSSPITENHASDLPRSSAEGGTCTIKDSQESLLNSGDSSDSPSSVDPIADTGGSEENKINGLSSYGHLNGSEDPSSLLELKHETLKPFLPYRKEKKCIPAIRLVESNNKSTVRKVTGKSSYFRNKLSDENGDVKQCEEPTTDKEDASGSAYDPLSKGSLLENDCQKKATKKRKLTNGVLPLKNLQATSLFEEGDGFPNLTNRGDNVKNEGNFGCNISHLRNYSGIAEKSMERFVSLMSSFRYTGSRASGLRAPLKDVQNTCPIRSVSAPTEVSKHSYTPNN